MPSWKPSTQILPAAFAWGLLFLLSAIFFGCASESLATQYSVFIPIYQGLLTAFVVTNFAFATTMDPGIYPRASEDESKADQGRAPLYKNTYVQGVAIRMKWCQTCRFYRPPRCSHCSICDHCIEVFDHHCPWVNNCIGRRNYRNFFLFLLSLTLNMCCTFGFAMLSVVTNSANLVTVQNILLIIDMVIVGLLLIPVAGLTVFHIYLVVHGKTTNEQMTGKLKGMDNPYTKGWFINLRDVFCSPQWPQLTNRSNKPSSVDLDNLRLVYQASGNTNKVFMESRKEPHQNGKHVNQSLNSSGWMSGKDFDDVHSISKHISSDMNIPLGGSAHSLIGHGVVGLGAIQLAQKSYSSSSFPLVQLLDSSSHSLRSQADLISFSEQKTTQFQPVRSRPSVPSTQPSVRGASSLSGMAEIGQGMGVLGFSRPVETSLASSSGQYSGAKVALKSGAKSSSLDKTERDSRRSSKRALDQKRAKDLASVSYDSIDFKNLGSHQTVLAGSSGQGALGASNWGFTGSGLQQQSAVGRGSSVPRIEENPAVHSTKRRSVRRVSKDRTGDRGTSSDTSGSHPGEKKLKATQKQPSSYNQPQQGMSRQPVPSSVATAVSNLPGSVRRPMSFVKALEVSDQLASVEQQWERDPTRRHMLSPQIEEEPQSVFGIPV